MKRSLSLLVLLFVSPVLAAGRPDVLIADFEGETYGAGWKTTGIAFGKGPAKGTLPNQMLVKIGLVDGERPGDRLGLFPGITLHEVIGVDVSPAAGRIVHDLDDRFLALKLAHVPGFKGCFIACSTASASM
jgi:hypothetical protein